MAAAKLVKAVLKNTAVLKRDGKEVTLKPGEQQVSEAELKLLTEAGVVKAPEAEEVEEEKAAE